MSGRGAMDTFWRGDAGSDSISPCRLSTEGVDPRLEGSVFLLTWDENGFVPAVEGRDALGDERSPRRRSSLMKNGDSTGNLTPSGRLEEIVITRENATDE